MSEAKIELLGTAYNSPGTSHVTIGVETVKNIYHTSFVTIGIKEADGSMASIVITKSDFLKLAMAVGELPS